MRPWCLPLALYPTITMAKVVLFVHFTTGAVLMTGRKSYSSRLQVTRSRVDIGCRDSLEPDDQSHQRRATSHMRTKVGIEA